MTHCGRSGMSDYIRMVHIKNEHSCHGHYSHGCSNIWSHCCGGGTSFMGGVGAGLAYSLVNWAMSGLTNWIGGMGFGGGNWFGGMGWGNVGFGGGNYGFWGLNGANGSRSTNGDYYSRRYGSSTRTSGSESANGADGVKNENLDANNIADFQRQAKALVEAKRQLEAKEILLKSEAIQHNNDVDALIDKLNKYSMLDKDPTDISSNKTEIDRMKKLLERAKINTDNLPETLEEKPENPAWVNPNSWTDEKISEDLKGALSNITLPSVYTKIGNNEEIENVKLAKDLKGITKDVIDADNSGEISEAKYENTEFPLYIQLTTKSNNNYQYKCIGVENGYPIYATPDTDNNNNKYILVKNGNGDYILLQVNDKFDGWGKEDTQCR